MYICVRGFAISSFYGFDFGIVPTVWYLFVFNLSILHRGPGLGGVLLCVLKQPRVDNSIAVLNLYISVCM
jgi:hypothetical protein